MKLKEERRRNPKNKGEPVGPPPFLFEPRCGARVASQRCPILRVGLLKYNLQNSTQEKISDDAKVLIRRFSRRIPTAPRQLDVSP